MFAKPLSADEVSINWVGGVGNSLSQSVDFYGSAEALRIAETMLLYQRSNGGWPKKYDWAAILSSDNKKKLLVDKSLDDTTIDNGATRSEVRYLAKVYNATGDERYKEALLRGVEFMLEMQYDNGGWPQFYPRSRGYAKHITFNDGAMIGVMTTLRDIAHDKDSFSFASRKLRNRCAEAVDRGIDCILNCQIEVDGQKTAWCAQHDLNTMAPTKARSYELISLSGSESVGVVKFLMEIDKPTPQIVEAVQGAITWFNEAKLTGIRLVERRDKSAPEGKDLFVIKDAKAPPMWARFYEIGSNKPIFCSRDGVPKDTIAQISYERRNGYSWLGDYAANLLKKDYPAWQKKWTPNY
jgi:PelA/Pel-15E family pectate lyase